MIDVVGKIVDSVTTIDGAARVTIEMQGTPELDDYSGPGAPPIRVRIAKARKARSLDANAYFWSCVAIIQATIGGSKGDIYRRLLRDYGQYTYLVVEPEAVPRLMQIWREVEVLGDTTTTSGKKGKSVIAYFGSSTYNSKEMSQLIDGAVDDIKALGKTPPPTRDMEQMLEAWREHHG